MLAGQARATAASGAGSCLARIPIELDRNRTIVKVQVADSRPQQLILDTGMPMDGVYLFHTDFTDEVTLEGTIEVQVPGAGSGAPSTAIMADSVSLSAGAAVFGRQRVIVSHSAHTQSFPTDGVIGWSLFGHFAVEVDYDKMLIALHAPGAFAADSSWRALPMKLKENIPWISVAVDVLGQGQVPIECYIDFASGDAIELLARQDSKFPIPENLEQSYLGTGLSGDIHGGVGRVAALAIGEYTLRDVTATFPAAGVRSRQENADAVIGNQLLRRFNLVFDYADSVLWIRPNQAFAEAF